MTINVKDERGLPMPASFSLAVTNDQRVIKDNPRAFRLCILFHAKIKAGLLFCLSHLLQ